MMLLNKLKTMISFIALVALICGTGLALTLLADRPPNAQAPPWCEFLRLRSGNKPNG